MRKKKKNEIIKVEKINELHTASITNNETINKEIKKPLLLSTTKNKLNTIIEKKDNTKLKENIFNINNIEKDIDLLNNNKINNKNKKINKKTHKNDKDIIKLKNNILINKDYKYENLINYVKSNKIKIINMLYKKKILKNKEVPLLLLLNLYANYINNDIEIIV